MVSTAFSDPAVAVNIVESFAPSFRTTFAIVEPLAAVATISNWIKSNGVAEVSFVGQFIFNEGPEGLLLLLFVLLLLLLGFVSGLVHDPTNTKAPMNRANRAVFLKLSIIKACFR